MPLTMPPKIMTVRSKPIPQKKPFRLGLWLGIAAAVLIAASGTITIAFFPGVFRTSDAKLEIQASGAFRVIKVPPGGSLQAASRTMMVFHTTPDRATEAFGLYALSGKATTFLGTMGIALFTLLSGSSRLGIAIPLIALFILGMIVLKWVKPMGERA